MIIDEGPVPRAMMTNRAAIRARMLDDVICLSRNNPRGVIVITDMGWSPAQVDAHGETVRRYFQHLVEHKEP